MGYLRTRPKANRYIFLVLLIMVSFFTACSGGKVKDDAASSDSGTASGVSGAASDSFAVSATEVTRPAEVVNDGTLLGELLKKVKDGPVHIKFVFTTETNRMDSEIYLDGDKTCLITTDKSDVTVRDILIDGKTYSIFDDQKLYAQPPESNTSDFVKSMTHLFGMDGSLFFTGVTGEEEFGNEKLYFEEFRRGDKKANLNRFYFKDGVLKGCYAAYGSIIEVSAFDDEIPDGIFEIPEGYKEEIIDESEWDAAKSEREAAKTDGV